LVVITAGRNTKPFKVDEFMDMLDAALIFSRTDGSRGKEKN
jgi:hypothetical protein